MLGGAAASAGVGALFGGPVGAAAVGGGAIASGLVAETIYTIYMNYGECQSDNWAYCQTGPYKF